jgi:asparagine synthetase A
VEKIKAIEFMYYGGEFMEQCDRAREGELVCRMEKAIGDFLKLPYHQAVMNNEVPLSIGGSNGQSRRVMFLLRKA